MKFKFWITCILWLFMLTQLRADPIKKALKSYYKQKYETVEKLLVKSLSKDSLNPGAKYTYSLLYSNQSFSRFHIDSAHYYILSAIRDYGRLDEKRLAKAAKIPLEYSTLQTQGNYVDSLAFDRAKFKDSLAAYIYFIEQYPEAIQLPEAIIRRDELAYQKAEEINTYQSFLNFIQQYPEALQVPEAQTQYDRLLFQDQVGGGRLDDYVNFITKYPLSPYRQEAETQIFEISISDGLPMSFLKHIQDRPASSANALARDMLFHLVKNNPASEVWGQTNWMNDSLRMVMSLDSLRLHPIYENGEYGFAQANGELVLPLSFDSLSQKYLCGNIGDDLLLVYQNKKWLWITRTGAIWISGDYEEIEDIGYGFLKIEKDQKFGLWHKSGAKILDTLYQDIDLLQGRFITFQQDGLWGLATLTGRVIFEPIYISIKFNGPVVTIQKEDLVAAVYPAKLAAAANQEPLSLDFTFEEVEWLDDHHLRGYYEDQEALISDRFNIPLGPQRIYDSYQGWYMQSDQGIRFFNSNLHIDSLYEDIVNSPCWLGLKKDGRWQVYDSSLVQATEHYYDSVALLGNQMLYLTKGDSTFIQFKNGQIKLLKPTDKITLWPGKSARPQSKSDDLILISSDRNWQRVYNNLGRMIYRTQYYNLRPLSNDYFEIERNGRKGLVDLNGKMVLKAQYSGQSAGSGPGISLLNRGTFGLFTTERSLIKPQFETKLVQMGPDLFLAAKNGMKGLINSRNKTLLPFEYNHIEQWNDSTYLIKQGKNYQLYNLAKKETVDQEIQLLEFIKSNGQEKVIIFKKETGYGVRSNVHGEIIAPEYDDIINLGSADKPVYFTEKRIPEADYYVILYYNQSGEIVRKQVFEEKDYDKILCY
ncbi:MAG: tetratricopeptide repeat protein [Cyclobacteriaceae bacterium]